MQEDIYYENIPTYNIDDYNWPEPEQQKSSNPFGYSTNDKIIIKKTDGPDYLRIFTQVTL